MFICTKHDLIYRKSQGIHENTTRANKQSCKVQDQFIKINCAFIHQQ